MAKSEWEKLSDDELDEKLRDSMEHEDGQFDVRDALYTIKSTAAEQPSQG